MTKSKTKKSAAKRFSTTAKGRLKRTRSGRRHLLGGKKRKTKRNLRRPAIVDKSDEKRIKKALPYG